LTEHPLPFSGKTLSPLPVKLAGEQYIAVTEDLSPYASAPLQLIVMKSFDQAERSIRQIDHLMLIAGLLALVLGTILMMALSRVVTRPLEELATGVRAFGVGDSSHLLPHRGTMEVQELSAAFARMRNEIQQANRALLESERLATIGRMASSVSHDLRHYLAAVYANAEFLASGKLSEPERNEIFADIRTAVHGTTELLESLLIFSRTGTAIRRSHELMATLLERAVALIRAHPDAAGVTVTVKSGDPARTMAILDGKQIERAIYNLLLNACQSAHLAAADAQVIATLDTQDDGRIILEIKDNGPGVPEKIRTTLFEPFVSEGKQKGSGLGLTLAYCVAAEHGGEVILVSSRPGETIFRMLVARGFEQQDAPLTENRNIVIAE
jgi:signal transduction histidine kinase